MSEYKRWGHTFIHVVVGMAVSAPFFFIIGRLTASSDPAPILIDFDVPLVEQHECVCQPVACPVVECPMWPMHKKVLAATAETARMDAYLAGAESIWMATDACEAVAEHGPGSCCSQVVDQVWDVEYNLHMLNFLVMNESIENRNWWRACRELLRVWPTESAVEGNYPNDFPKYCW